MIYNIISFKNKTNLITKPIFFKYIKKIFKAQLESDFDLFILDYIL